MHDETFKRWKGEGGRDRQTERRNGSVAGGAVASTEFIIIIIGWLEMLLFSRFPGSARSSF
jgi:hypothetical protein